MKRQFALARHKYSFYDPVSNVHLTVDKPISPVIDDATVDVRRLERAAKLGSLIDLTPKQEKATAASQAPKTSAKVKASEKVDKEQAGDKADTEVASDSGEDGKAEEQEDVAEKLKAKASTAKKKASKDK